MHPLYEVHLHSQLYLSGTVQKSKAGRQTVTVITGTSIFHPVESFAMLCDGDPDLVVVVRSSMPASPKAVRSMRSSPSVKSVTVSCPSPGPTTNTSAPGPPTNRSSPAAPARRPLPLPAVEPVVARPTVEPVIAATRAAVQGVNEQPPITRNYSWRAIMHLYWSIWRKRKSISLRKLLTVKPGFTG